MQPSRPVVSTPVVSSPVVPFRVFGYHRQLRPDLLRRALAELLDLARKEFADASNAVTSVDERELEKGWPALCAALSATARAWRLKGLELLGIPQPAETSAQPCAAVASSISDLRTPISGLVPDAHTSFHVPAGPPYKASERGAVPGIKRDDMNLFAGLPLFELA